MKFIKICPRCGSTNIGIPKRGVDLLNMDMLCRDCGNIGVFPEMKMDQALEYRKKIQSGDSQESKG